MTEIGERKMERITIKEIAKLCGVGVSTVSRAINNHPDINEETKKKIMDTIKQYNYIPNNSARNLKRSASKTIGVLMKGMTNPFFTNFSRITVLIPPFQVTPLLTETTAFPCLLR